MKEANTLENPKTKFFEASGGQIYGPSGQIVAVVNIQAMRMTEAARCVAAIISALEYEFSKPQAEDGTARSH